MDYSITDKPSLDDIRYIKSELLKFSDQYTKPRDYKELIFALKDGSENVLGGIIANTIWDWLRIEVFWISENIRKKGYGRKLIEHVESKAMDLGCKRSMVETFDFEALDFYQKNGYMINSEIKHFPEGHTHYCLIKKLAG